MTELYVYVKWPKTELQLVYSLIVSLCATANSISDMYKVLKMFCVVPSTSPNTKQEIWHIPQLLAKQTEHYHPINSAQQESQRTHKSDTVTTVPKICPILKSLTEGRVPVYFQHKKLHRELPDVDQCHLPAAQILVFYKLIINNN